MRECVCIETLCKRIYAGGDVPKDRFSEVRTEEFTVPIYANAEKDEGLYGYTDEAKEYEPSITVAARGTIGYTAIRKTPFLPVVRLITVVPKLEMVDLRYMYYALKNCKPKSSGTSIPQLTVPDIKKYSFEMPSKEEQILIVSVLDSVKNIIDKRKEELLEIDNLIKSRFVEMFGNPLDKDRVNYYFTECVEFNPKKSEVKDMQDVEVSFVPMECVGVDGSFTIKETGLVQDYYSGYTYFRDGDVLLAKITPCFENGKVAVATECTNGIGFGTTEFHVSRPLKGITNSTWIKYLLKNDMVHDLATINMSGSAGQKRIQTPFFNKLRVYVPPIKEQEFFSQFVTQVDKLKFEVQKSLDETQLLMDSLMQQYFG